MQNFSSKKETNKETNQARCLLAVFNKYSNNYLELFQSSWPVSMEIQWLRSVEGFKYKLYKRNIWLFSKSNQQKRQSLPSFSKHNKVWNKGLRSLGKRTWKSLS